VLKGAKNWWRKADVTPVGANAGHLVALGLDGSDPSHHALVDAKRKAMTPAPSPEEPKR
jgi:hypothetical protein